MCTIEFAGFTKGGSIITFDCTAQTTDKVGVEVDVTFSQSEIGKTIRIWGQMQLPDGTINPYQSQSPYVVSSAGTAIFTFDMSNPVPGTYKMVSIQVVDWNTGYIYCSGIPATGVCSQVTISGAAITLKSITISPSNVAIIIEGTRQFTATCLNQSGVAIGCPILTWQSSNSSVAAVNSNGLVTGISSGTVTITCKDPSTGITSNQATVTVSQAPPTLGQISISPATASIAVGGVELLTAVCRDTKGNIMDCPLLTWTSIDPSIATAEQNPVGPGGLVTGVSTGTVNITASYGGVISNQSIITVSGPALYTIILSPASATVNIGETKKINADCFDQSGNKMTCPTLLWTSNNPSVATVDSTGLVTGVSNGYAVIIASYSGVSNLSLITVGAVPTLYTITLSPLLATVINGQTQKFTAECRDQNGNVITCPTLLWETSDSTLGTIDSSGVFTAKASSGTVNVTATVGPVTGIAIVTLSTPAQFGFGTIEMIAIAGLAIGFIYLAIRK